MYEGYQSQNDNDKDQSSSSNGPTKGDNCKCDNQKGDKPINRSDNFKIDIRMKRYY
jgi:hypothetical protein